MAIPENIEQLANDIRTKIYGRDVREALASGIEAAGSIANDADIRSQETETKQTNLEKKYDEQIANMSLENPSVAEVVDARVSGYDGQNFDTIGKRMDKVDAQLAQKMDWIAAESFSRIAPEVNDNGKLQRAIDEAVAKNKPLFLNHGIYYVSRPLRPNKNLDPNNVVEGFTLIGAFGIPKYDDYKMPSMIEAESTFTPYESILDLRYTRQCTVMYIGLKGKSDITGIEFGERTVEGRMFSGHTVEYCSIYGCYDGIASNNAGLLRIRFNNISRCTRSGIGLLKFAGDSELLGNYLNTNNSDYQGSDVTYGSGMLIGEGSNNVNIIGGKIEWNAKGIFIYGAGGINIAGVIFDVNKWCNVLIKSFNNTDKACRSVNITGNRFLSGGSHSGNIGKASIVLDALEANSAIAVTIGSNSFKKGGTDAYDLNTLGIVSPLLCGIRAEAVDNSTIDLTVTGNDMKDCSEVATMILSGTNVSCEFNGNNYNLPIELYNNAKIYEGKTWGRLQASAFKGQELSVQTIPPTTYTKLNYTTELFDRKENYDAPNSIFIANKSSIYHFSVSVELTNVMDAQDLILRLNINNGDSLVRLSSFKPGGEGYFTLTGSALLQLNQGDTVKVELYSSTEVSTSGLGESCYFAGVEID